MAAAIAEPPAASSCAAAWRRVAQFAVVTVAVSLLLSLLVQPFVELSWWKVFRRCVSVAAAFTLWLVTRHEGGLLRRYGLGGWRSGKRQLAFGLGLGAAVLALLLGGGLALGLYQPDVTPDRLRLWRTVIGFLPAAALVGLLEELIFRGFLLQQLLACSKPGALVLSSAAYSLVHLREAPVTLGAALELAGLFLLGTVLALSYLRTRHLYLAIGLHASLAYGARINKLLVTVADPSLAWLTGTSRLVNGLLGWAALAGIGGIIARWAHPPHQGGLGDAQR